MDIVTKDPAGGVSAEPRINFPIDRTLRDKLNKAAARERISVRDLLPLLATAYVKMRKVERNSESLILSKKFRLVRED